MSDKGEELIDQLERKLKFDLENEPDIKLGYGLSRTQVKCLVQHVRGLEKTLSAICREAEDRYDSDHAQGRW